MTTTSIPPVFLIADDHSIVRNGLVTMIGQIFEKATVFQAGNFQEIRAQFDNHKIDLLILDISFPEGSSLQLLSELKERQPAAKILVFSSFDEEIYALRYIKSGADGYLSKLSSPEEIEHAIRVMITKGKFTSDKIRDKIIDTLILKKSANPLENLSNREMEIASLLVKGYGNLEITNELNLKATTVSTYKVRVFDKLGISNLSDLIQTFNLHNDHL